MQSSMISKIQKARQYAEEPDRLSFGRFTATFRGENDTHQVDYDGGKWRCDCHFFEGHGVCSHTMAIERILGASLPRAPLSNGVAQPASA